tara:strand:+ start:675 stop:2462 length:1788 start_codon:yes stop_codon:yes gene_type:complete
MSGSYWKVGDKMNIGQSDIEISCEGGKEYQENQVIGIYIPPSVKFFSGKDSMLQFDLKLATGGATSLPTKLCLDGVVGSQSLFSRVACYAGNRQDLLEELQEYSSWVNIKYSYDTSDAIRNKRAMTEGCGTWLPETKGSAGTTKSIQSDSIVSQFNSQPNKDKATNSTIDATTQSEYITARISMPLHMGCFANSQKAFPNLLTNGLFVELTCAPNRHVCRVLDQTSIFRKLSFAPFFASIDGADAPLDSAAAAGQTAIFTENDNSQLDPSHSPFNVGEEIGFMDRATGLPIALDAPAIIETITAGNTGNKQGIKYTLANAGIIPVSTLAGDHARTFCLFSKSRKADFAPSYKISNPKLVVRQLDMGSAYESGMASKMKQGGVIMFDLPSISCNLQSVGKDEVQATIPISCEHAKARSLICMGSDSKPYTAEQACDSSSTYMINNTEPNALATDKGKDTHSQQPFISGIGDGLTSYNFLIEGKQVPSRRVETAKTSSLGAGIDQNHLIELEKSLIQAHGCTPRSFVNYQNNFLIGRALTLDSNTIYDGRNKDLRLNLRYEGADDAIRGARKEKIWKIFISHVKTIQIKGDSIQVQH